MHPTRVRSLGALWLAWVSCMCWPACSSSPAPAAVRCGEGTVLVGETCVSSDAGASGDAGALPREAGTPRTCPQGSVEQQGECVSVAPPLDAGPGLVCAQGTREVDGQCVRLDCFTSDDCAQDALCVSNRCQALGACADDAACGGRGQRCVLGHCRSECPSSAANACAELHAGWRCVQSGPLAACVPVGAIPGAACLVADGCSTVKLEQRELAVSCVNGVCRAECNSPSVCQAWGADLSCTSSQLCFPKGSALGAACSADNKCSQDAQHDPAWPLRCVDGACAVDCSPQPGQWPGYAAALCQLVAPGWHCSAAKGLVCAPEAAPAPGSIAAENALKGTADWQLSNPATAHEIEGYAGATSVNRGQSIQLYVSTSAPGYRIDVYRLGYYAGLGARQVAGPVHRTGTLQVTPQPDADGRIECEWSDPYILQTSEQWTSGIYLARLTADESGEQSFIPFVLRDDTRASDYLFQSSVTTHQAYNNWGGKSLYDFNSDGNQRAYKVSFNRPYALGLNVADAARGVGAGEVLTNAQAATEVRANGWEYPMLRFLEREGYDVTYATNIDLHADPELLASHKALLSIGHDEYWSYAMRSYAELARDRWGTHLGFFSGNDCYWQVRFESDRQARPNRTLVVYKDDALDPLAGTQDAHLVTTRWHNAPLRYSELGLVGVHYAEAGVYDDLVVDDESSWPLAGTGLRRGDRVPGLLGYEVDAVGGALPAGVTRIMLSPWSTGTTTGLSDMITFQMPSGAITFAAGSIQLSWGLDDFGQQDWPRSLVSSAAQQMTRNLLARFALPGAPTTQQTLLADDFTADVRDAERWSIGVVTEAASAHDPNVLIAQGGRLTITPRDRQVGLHHNGYVSARTWDMTHAVASVELVNVPRAASNADTTFALAQDGEHWVRFTQESSALVLQLRSGTLLDRQSLAYDAVQQRHLRLRHVPDTSEFLWEASSDGQSFSTLWRRVHDFPVAAMRVELEAGSYESAVGIGVAAFDNFQLTQSGFADSFDGYRRPEYWTPGVLTQGGDSYALRWLPIQSNGTLRLRPSEPDSTLRGTGYLSTRSWDLTGGEASVELGGISGSDASTVFALAVSAGDWVRIRVKDGQLQCQDSVAGDIHTVERAYAPLEHRFLKLAHHADMNTWSCETSPDAQAWTVVRSMPAAIARSAMRAELALYAQQPSAAGNEARFEQFRLRTALAP